MYIQMRIMHTDLNLNMELSTIHVAYDYFTILLYLLSGAFFRYNGGDWAINYFHATPEMMARVVVIVVSDVYSGKPLYFRCL